MSQTNVFTPTPENRQSASTELARKPLLTAQAAAEWCNLKLPTFYDKVRRNEVAGVVWFGRILRVDPDKLAAWIDSGGEQLDEGWRRGEQ